jgi:tetratricopeptide (TPR) repeat protein
MDFETAVKLAPHNAAFWKDLARVKPSTPEIKAEAAAFAKRAETYIKKEEWDRVIEECAEALPRDPHNAAAYFYYRGLAYHQGKKNYGKAIEDFETAVKLEPDNDDYREYLERAQTAKDRGK